MTRWWRRPTRYAHGLTTNPGSANGCSIVHAPPRRSRASRTSTLRPARARYAAAVRPLCPAPTTIASHVVDSGASVSGMRRSVEHNLADDLTRLHEPVRLAGLFKGKQTVDHRPKAFVGKSGHDRSEERRVGE